MSNKQDKRKLLIFIKKILSDSLPYKNGGFYKLMVCVGATAAPLLGTLIGCVAKKQRTPSLRESLSKYLLT